MFDFLMFKMYINNMLENNGKGRCKMKGIIIARVSKGEQGDEGHYSLSVQVKRLQDYAKQKGVEIVEEFIIKGESAYRGKRNQFIKAISKGVSMSGDEGFALFIQNPDRFSRQVASKVVLQVEELRKEGKIKIYSLNPEMCLHKDSSAMELGTWNILIAVASMQSGITGDKIKASIQHKLSKNEYPGFAPTGYLQPFQEDGKKVITIDQDRAPLVKELYELYVTGNYSMAELTKMMRSYGLTIKPKGKREARALKRGDVQQILNCKMYCGWFDWNGKEYKASNYEAIITRELWENVQKVLSEKAIKYGTKHTSTAKFYIYRGLLKCGYCGMTMTPNDMSLNYKNKKPGESIYYRCSYSKKNVDPNWYRNEFGENHSGVRTWKGKKHYNCPNTLWTEEEIEIEVKKYLKRLAYDKTVIQKIKETIGAEFKERMSAFSLQKKSVEAEVSKRSKLIESLIDKLAIVDLTDIADDIQDRIKVVKSEVEGLKAQLNTMDEFGEEDFDQVVEALSLTSDLYKQFDKLSDMDKRRVVISAFSEIQLRKGWVGSEKDKESTFNAKWSTPFHELWFKWVRDHVNVKTLGQELAFEEWIDSLDEQYLDSMQKDSDYWRDKEEQEGTTGEDLIKMKDSL